MWMLALFFTVIYITVSGLTTGDEFHYLQRKFEDNKWTLSLVSDIEDEPDEWPSGAYTLLMSKYGCPRGRWNRGYITFTWTTPHVMLSHTNTYHCDNYNTNNRCHRLISEKTRPTSYSNMFGPFSQYKMTLNFCQKINNTEREDPYVNSIWPKTYFRTLDAHGECPQGFYPAFHNITLPSVEKWTENGFVPYFSLNNDQENKKAILTLKECVRDGWNEQNVTNNLNTNGSAFILLKDEEHPCPVIETYGVWPEIISIVDVKNASSGVSHLFQFCFYQSESWKDINTNSQEMGDYELGPISVVFKKAENSDTITDSQEVEGNTLLDHTHAMLCKKHSPCWLIIDIGRSMSINGVLLEKVLPTGAVFSYSVQAGNDKFELIRYGGVEIPHDKVGSSFVGRYILFIIPNLKSTIHRFSVRVFVEHTDKMCMVDIGMTDGSITKDQIFVTPKQHSTNINSPRPVNTGWCANDADINPYVQVDLLEETWLDGITIYNWYKTHINMTNGAYGTCQIPMGTRSLKVVCSSDEKMSKSYNMTFYVDTFRPTDEPQTFIFYEHIRARYVRILLLEPMVQGQLCIRFELHGCRNNEIIDRPSLIYQRDSNDDVVTGAVKLLMSPSQLTSVGHPQSYRDGTSYTWIIDFRSIGYIRLLFKEVSLQFYEDLSLVSCSYLCKDSLAISSFDSVWTFPPQKHTNVIIETDTYNMVVQFTSCNPYTHRIKRGVHFNVYADKSDLPVCSSIQNNYLRQYCRLPSMMMSTLSLNNIPSDNYIESWIIVVPKHSIRLTILYFHILCNSGAVLEIKEQFSATKSYTDCSSPETVLLSESEQMTITYKAGQVSINSLVNEGFRAMYTTVEINHQNLLDTIGHHYYGLRKIGFTYFHSSSILPDGSNNGASLLVYKACSVTLMKCYTIYSRAPMSWQVAGDECWARGKKLVSIHSKEELFVVRYMLRTFRNVLYDDNTVSRIYTTDIADPNYYSHIGLSRITKANGNRQFVWHDGSPALFSAWNTGEPDPDGDCVRMSFHLANKNNTWEVEDCVTQMALFFICEEPVNSLPLPELKSINSKVYTGKMNTTKYGKLCQRWDSMVPHGHTYTAPHHYPGRNISLSENYCRDPVNDGHLWCYTMDPFVRWEKCDDTNLYDWTPEAYNGRLSTTVSGYTCQRWDSQSPHTHQKGLDEYFADNTVSDAANYCRDPSDGEGTLWCYTTDPDVRFDYCNHKDTISDRCYETHYPYLGTMNVTYSGLTCQHWSSSYPHKHYYSDTKFPDVNISKAENYCRDPSNEGYLWCFTTDPDVRWESCAIPVNVKLNTTDTLINDMYHCNDGYQISTKKICNGIVDCSDAQDELNCTYKVQKLLGSHVMNGGNGKRLEAQFRCGSNEYISLLAECNGVVDCIDGSDERLCKRDTKACTSDEFQCGNGRCIHASLVCDFIPQCTDFSDENCDHPKCKQGEYRCNNGQCIPMSNRCNAYEECVDGSDEQSCETCGNNAFHCDLTKCIPERLVCDNAPDCKDMKDENEHRCKHQQYLRCEDRWLSGLRTNGHYPVTGYTFADCNFDNVKKDGSILTVYRAVQSRSEARIHYIEIASTSSEKLTLNANTTCHQTFTQTCTLAVLSIAEIEDMNLENHFKHCRCVVLTVTLNQPKSVSVHSCGNETDRLHNSVMRVKYDFAKKALVKQMPFNKDIEIKIGSIVCKNDTYLSHQYNGVQNETVDGLPCQRWDEQDPHSHSRNDIRRFPDSTLESAENYCRDPDFTGVIWCYTLDPYVRWQECRSDDFVQQHKDLVNDTRRTCEEDGFTYDENMQCIYETDEAGYIRGCRSGSHLQNCSDFECPNGTIKCPGSFCIPVHYVCDGVNQCQSSEDEDGCDCNNDDLELILMASKKEMYENDLKLRQVASQFNNQNAIVRILYYNAYMDQDIMPFEHRILQISDTEVNQKNVRSHEYECTYSTTASRFMNQVKFTKVKSRGLIFIQNGTDSEFVARQMFQDMSRPEFDVYRLDIGHSNQLAEEKDDGYRYVTDLIVNSLDILSSMGHKLFPSLCKGSSSTLCQDSFKCSSSQLCITFDKVCDGYAHCPLSDDEMFCEFVCPSVCSCSGYSANCKSAAFENSTNISQGIDRRLRVLDLSTNTRVGAFANSNDGDLVFKFPYMVRLNLSACNIWLIGSNDFEHLPNLRSLDLSYNKISRILRRTFFGLSKLVYLNMYGNKGFMIYESFAFLGLTSLRNFDIIDSEIQSIASKTFSGLKLDTLQISHNIIVDLKSDAFSELVVRNIIFESNSITTFDRGLFNGISDLQLLRTSAYKYCCVRPNYLPESSCFPERDEFSSCDDLMRNTALQIMLWVMGICALLGNILAVAYRIGYDREKLKLGFGIFVVNLAVSDLLMGVYLLIIAIADASYRKRYIFMDDYWRNSGWCTLAGVLATVSSEASVLFLCLITFDRFLVIKYPLSGLRFTPRNASIAAAVAWIISVSISITPLIDKDYFQNKFYSKSGVCVALPLTRDRPPGWLYSVIIFIGVNFVTFVVIAIGQISIYNEINHTSSAIRNKRRGQSKASRRRELTIARNLFLVVATDFMCWIPICFMGIVAMSGYIIPGQVYAWVAVFILPVNSSVNPFLYTLTTLLGNRRPKGGEVSNLNKIITTSAKKKLGSEKLISFFIYQYSTTMTSVESLIEQNIVMSPNALLKFTIQMTDCLRLLHKNSLVLDTLDAKSVFVPIQDGKFVGDLQIRQQPSSKVSLENKTETRYKLGVILRRLMACSSNQRFPGI